MRVQIISSIYLLLGSIVAADKNAVLNQYVQFLELEEMLENFITGNNEVFAILISEDILSPHKCRKRKAHLKIFESTYSISYYTVTLTRISSIIVSLQ